MPKNLKGGFLQAEKYQSSQRGTVIAKRVRGVGKDGHDLSHSTEIVKTIPSFPDGPRPPNSKPSARGGRKKRLGWNGLDFNELFNQGHSFCIPDNGQNFIQFTLTLCSPNEVNPIADGPPSIIHRCHPFLKSSTDWPIPSVSFWSCFSACWRRRSFSSGVTI